MDCQDPNPAAELFSLGAPKGSSKEPLAVSERGRVKRGTWFVQVYACASYDISWSEVRRQLKAQIMGLRCHLSASSLLVCTV